MKLTRLFLAQNCGSSHPSIPSLSFIESLTLLACATFLVVGCGGNPSKSTGGGTGPIAGESTSVAVQLSSTANDQFIHFNMTINSIALTNKAGATTTIFSTPTDVDFIPSNGNAAPFATVTVPQDVYTSAAVAVSNPRFSYTGMESDGSIFFATDAYGYTPTPPVVNLASPITVDGSTMGLTLNLLTSPSGSYDGPPPNQISYTINPTFNLTPFTIPSQPTSPLNGKGIGLVAQVTTVDSGGKSMTVTIAGDPLTGSQPLTVALNSSTAYQGSATAGNLAPGDLINMDIALQPDATYAATRVEIQDATATNINTGQVVEFDPSYNNYLMSTSTQQEGAILSTQPVGMGYPYEFDDSTAFQTSARFPNLSSLPFNAVFNGSTLAPGQMVSIGSTSISFLGGTWTDPTSVTLVPQTIDGSVIAVATSGNYTVYTAQLAPYDQIVQMNSPQNAAVNTHLSNLNAVQVYVDSSTSQLNATPLSAGGTFRFDGLLFNDGGVLRMVCDRVEDGVQQ